MGLISKPWKNENESVAIDWIKKQKGNRSVLAKAAMHASSYRVRVAAVEQLTSEPLLKLVATSDEHHDNNIKSLAIKKISDQVFLTKLAKEGWEDAILSLTNQDVLVQILTDPWFFRLRGGNELAIYHMNGERGRKIERQDRIVKEKRANNALYRLSELTHEDSDLLREVCGRSSYVCAGRYIDTGRISMYLNLN